MKLISLGDSMNEFTGLRWFNLGGPTLLVAAPHRPGRVYVRLWNAHRRHSAKDGKWWGFGLLQIGNRHLAYIGRESSGAWRVSLLFIGRTH